MKKIRTLFLALPLFALGLTGCVKYNGRGSSNPSEKVTFKLSKSTLSLEEGATGQLTVEYSKNTDVYWGVDNDKIASLDVTTGLTANVSALTYGDATITAYADYNGKRYSATCALTVTRKGSGGGGGGGQGGGGGESQPVEGEEVSTYLVIGENGRYKGEQGKDFETLFLEYAVEFKAKVGDPLPTKADVTSTVTDSEFVCWQSYEGDGALTKHTVVPNARGKILYASFSGGHGSVTPTPTPTPTPSTNKTTIYFAGIASWNDPTSVQIRVNDLDFVTASKEGQLFKTEFTVESFTSVSCYMSQNNGGKYFHPYNGSYDKMDSTINTGTVTLTAGKQYVITFIGWHDDTHWETDQGVEHGWFDYKFAEISA